MRMVLAWLCGSCLLALGCGAHAGGVAISAGLQCRLGDAPWRPCAMAVDGDRLRWALHVGRETVNFRSDGRGRVWMQRSTDGWRTVEPLWRNDSSLCWDGICALGHFPLD